MVNQTDIADVMRKYPDLTIDGLAGDRRPDFERRRTALSGAVSEFERAVAWLSRVPKRKSANRDDGYSYGLKHAAEAWAGAYLPNGALIAAAVHLGFPCDVHRLSTVGSVLPVHENGRLGITGYDGNDRIDSISSLRPPKRISGGSRKEMPSLPS
jgi:hypothetical protein